jgi:hypothetical protein
MLICDVSVFVSYMCIPDFTLEILACRMSSSDGDGGRRL